MTSELSDDVREVLEPLAEQYVTCRRVLEYLEGERPAWKVKTNDYLRVLEASEGELALDLSGSNTGSEQYGYDPEREACPYDVWIFSQINADLGDRPPEWTETTTKRGLKHTLEDRHCGVILRSESNLVEDEDGEDGTAAAAMTDGGQGVFCSDHPRARVKATVQHDTTGNPVTEYSCMDCGRRIDRRTTGGRLVADGGTQVANDGNLQCKTCGASVDPMHAYRCTECGRDLVDDGEGSA